MRKTLGVAVLKILGWKFDGQTPAPAEDVTVLVAAPHTSALDFPVMLAAAYAHGIDPKFLAKKELFTGAMGVLTRNTGGIPVDRANPAGLVDDLVRRAKSGKAFALVIPAEGTRKVKKYWKSGFYRIALQAEVPVTLTYMDGPTKTYGFGPTFMLTGDVRADMDKVRAFYKGKRGVKPELRTEPRLREEDETAEAPESSTEG